MILWFAVIVLSVCVVALLVRLAITPLTYFSKMDYSQVAAKPLKIPAGDVDLNACYYLPRYALDENNRPVKGKLPLIVLHPGWGQAIDQTFLKQWAVFLALSGPYAVLTYDFRGIGKTPGKLLMTPKLLEDVPKVIDFGTKLPEINPDKLGFIGFSFGALVALTTAYSDTRIKAIVSIVGLSNAKGNFSRKPKNLGELFMIKSLHMAGVKPEILSEDDNRKMSPDQVMKPDRKDLNSRVFLMNCVNDSCIAFDSFGANQKILDLPPEQALVTQKGGHAGFHQELILTARIAQFFHSKLG